MRRATSSLTTVVDGAVLVEFALVAPVMLMLIMVLADLTFQGYAQSVLTGAMQKAARDSTIQGNAAISTTIDAKVENAMRGLLVNPTFNAAAARRKNYDNYATIGGEPFTDSKFPNNSSGVYDGICNHNETYLDVNSNGRYDLDLSQAGQGGANDVTLFNMTVTYTRLFPLTRLLLGSTVTLASTTVLKNQPYMTQTVYTGTTTGTCA